MKHSVTKLEEENEPIDLTNNILENYCTESHIW